MPPHSVLPSIASILAQHVDSKDDPLPSSSDSPPIWREWALTHSRVQSEPPLPNVFEQAFTLARNTKDIRPYLHIPEYSLVSNSEADHEEHETAIIEIAQVAQAVRVQLRLEAIQASDPAISYPGPSLKADAEISALSLPPPIIQVTPATPDPTPNTTATSVRTSKQEISKISAERHQRRHRDVENEERQSRLSCKTRTQQNGKLLTVPEEDYVKVMKVCTEEQAKKAEEGEGDNIANGSEGNSEKAAKAKWWCF
jgi:hypothetical protein